MLSYMIYYDSFQNTCKVLGINIPFEEGRWPSTYVGEEFLSFDSVCEKMCAFGGGECTRKDYDAFKNYYKLLSDLNDNSTDICFLFADWLLSKENCNGCTAEEYFKYEFYRKELQERQQFICRGYRTHELCTCNDYAILNTVNDKKLFNSTFQTLIHRGWMDLSDANKSEVKEFLSNHTRTVVKPNSGSQGKGVRLLEVTCQEDIDSLAEKYAGRRMVLEEVVVQDPVIGSINSSSLNTIRIYTFSGKSGVPMIMGAAGRFGRSGSVIDNLHNGGLAVIINAESGCVISDGMDSLHNIYDCHPDSGIKFRGFHYPYWNRVRELALQAASLVAGANHIGWDIAINSDGQAELVEGNTEPDFDLIQVQDQKGKMYLYKSIVQEFKKYREEQIQQKGYWIHDVPIVDFKYNVNSSSMNGIVDKITMGLQNGSQKVSVVSAMLNNDALIDALSKNDVEICKWNDVIREYETFDTNASIFREADSCVLIFSLEYIKDFQRLLTDICQCANRQVIIVCRPIDKDEDAYERWLKRRFVLDFTEKFLVNEMKSRGFGLNTSEKVCSDPAAFIYDFIIQGG